MLLESNVNLESYRLLLVLFEPARFVGAWISAQSIIVGCPFECVMDLVYLSVPEAQKTWPA